MENIVLGIIASLTATVVWIWFLSLYVIRGRHKIDMQIEYAIDANSLLDKSLKYNHYIIALSQVDVLLKTLFEINSNIGYFNYWPNKRKLIYTLLFHSIRTLSIFKNLEIGSSGDDELQARCKKFSQKYFSDVVVAENETTNSSLIILKLIQELNSSNNLSGLFCNKLILFNATLDEQRDMYLTLIDVNSFRASKELNYYMRGKGVSKDKFDKIIEKCHKKSMTIKII